MPRAVLFDIGDTLLIEKRFDLEAGIASVAGTRAEIATLARDFRAEVAERHLQHSEPFLAAWLRDSVPGLDLESVESIEDKVWVAIVTLEPRPGIAMVLRALSEDGLLLGAVSNAAFSSPVLQAELERHGLASSLRFVVTSADAGSRKPAAAIFQLALTLLEVAPSDVWFVGDTLEEDIVGARVAGVQPIWLRAHASDTSPFDVPTVRDWREFMQLYDSVRALAG
jgi:HAD superfamily hydrolase (TIGR01509 family)